MPRDAMTEAPGGLVDAAITTRRVFVAYLDTYRRARDRERALAPDGPVMRARSTMHTCNVYCEGEKGIHCNTFHLWSDTPSTRNPTPTQDPDTWKEAVEEVIENNYGKFVRWEPCEAQEPRWAPTSRFTGQPQLWLGGFYIWWGVPQ